MGCSASHDVDDLAERNLQAYLEILFDAYGKPTEQVGYTDGHYCVTVNDKVDAQNAGASLLYGEVLASGVLLIESPHLMCALLQQSWYSLEGIVASRCWDAGVPFHL